MNVLKQQWLTLSEMMNDVTPDTPQWTLIQWQLDKIEDRVDYDTCLQWLDEEANELEGLFAKADDIMRHPMYS